MRPLSLCNQNQKTLASLQAKDFDGAVQSASCALRDLKRDIGSFDGIPPADEIAGDALDQCMHLNKVGCSISTDATSPFIYDRGIILPSTMEDGAIMTTVLVFNAALANHLLAISENNDRSLKYLHRARQLYQLAHEGQDIDQNFLFHFAVINNLALIDQSLGDAESSQKSFEYLISVIMILITQEQSAIVSQLSGFLVNMPFSIKATAAAAA
ncbi:unnamed protein product [Cylindrotheca closterium]|uniref:Uncharacterized protein n=1 Tax=Cylindrotheca closterium TaxID=2856 RepID=A0AAD2CJI8_9STRA|nr:unnamed protein product [Cylindrotheca closterium]